MKREIIRVEPFDSNFEKWGVPVSTGRKTRAKRLSGFRVSLRRPSGIPFVV